MKIFAAIVSLSVLFVGAPLLQAADAPLDPAAAMAAAMKMLGQMGDKNAGGATAVDAKEMRALLPDKDGLKGFKRTAASSESNAIMGFRVNTAKGEYKQSSGDGRITIQYQDIGAMGTFAKAAITNQEIDKESETGFERTVRYQGFKGVEKYDEKSKNGSIKLFVGERVAVEIEGNNLPFEKIKDVAEKLKLKELAALKATAPKTEE